MRRPRSATRELIAAVISGLVAVLGAVDLIGHPARTVHVLTIFVGGFSSGIAFGRAVDRRRAERQVTASAP
ncbi:MAG: hypothetical protein DMD35_20905 [Gemmatimonadetes bacterium]|nr:MAG: hypothetical protein DMD35_20905 [Gemmatimonadota bacterium]